jgi:pyruvate/2-oxoglutarate dehydrogenase complex dihydrolipoamide acyltransferase (E2) component
MSELVPIVMPQENVNDEHVLIVQWIVADGTWVDDDQLVAEVETSKALVEIHSPAAGYLKHVEPAGTEVAVGAPFAYLTPALDTPLPSGATTEKEASKKLSEPPAPPSLAKVLDSAEGTALVSGSTTSSLPSLTPVGSRFSPAAQALMGRHGVSPNSMATAGLVRAKDVMRLLGGGAAESVQRVVAREDASKAIPGAIPRFRRERLPRKKRMEVQRLSWAAQHALPSSVSTNCVTRGLKEILAGKTNGEVKILALIVFETARLLRKYPAFNAMSLDEEIGYYEDVEIGVAMDDGGGLVVPAVRHADQKTLFEIADELRELTVTYVDGKLTPEQLRPGTFTVTDLSAYGTSHFQPMINQHQSAILGIGSEQFLPGQATGFFTLTLAFDHAAAEGRTAALFLNDLRDHMASYEQTVADESWAIEAHCTRCLRTAAQLRELHEGHVLVRSEVPKGMICSLCLAGY